VKISGFDVFSLLLSKINVSLPGLFQMAGGSFAGLLVPMKNSSG
jgi:hypothetical protein